MRVTVVFLAVVLLGCEGGKGGFRVVSEMTDAELTDLCEDASRVFPPREIECEGNSVTVGLRPEVCATPDEFLQRSGCTATAGEVLDCVAAFDALSEAQFCAMLGGDSVPADCPDSVVACFGN